MFQEIDIWKFAGGLGLFLFGMQFMELSLRQFAGRAFKLFLRKHTENKLKAMGSGALVTGILQSSSVVSFIMLAFVGAGIVSMRNALAVVMGSNFGTTLDSWVVALLGFELDIESFAFPILGVSSLAVVMSGEHRKIARIGNFFIGFSLLFIGLAYIRDSVGAIVETLDLSQYNRFSPVVFMFIGFFITAVIQSSSAAMVITLSALHAGAVVFDSAVAVVIGSELGTTVKIMIGSLGGLPDKKRVALGNFLFNMAISSFAFIFLTPLIGVIRNGMEVSNPLIGLVLFQSIINFAGLILFYPFLDHFSAFLERRFSDERSEVSKYICKVSPDVEEAALDALQKEAGAFLKEVISFNLSLFQAGQDNRMTPGQLAAYVRLKEWEGEILSFYSRINTHEMDEKDNKRIIQLLTAVRNAMYSAKSMKDITQDVSELGNSVNDFKYRLFERFAGQSRMFYDQLKEITGIGEESSAFNRLVALFRTIGDTHDSFLREMQYQIGQKSVNGAELSTILNFNREIYSSGKHMLLAQKDVILGPQLAEAFDSLPSLAKS